MASTRAELTTRQPASADQIDVVMRRLHRLAPLREKDRANLRSLCRRNEVFKPNSVLIEEGAPIVQARFILSGWACRQRLLPDGRRQIFGLLIPGDAMGICIRSQPVATATTVAITRMVTVDASALLERIEAELSDSPLATALHKGASLDESYMLDQIVRLGRQTAYESMAHLLLELQTRLEVAGLATSGGFPMPLTQEMLADLLGLSSVHVNRTLQQLRRDHLIEFVGAKAILLDPAALAKIADYRPPPPYRASGYSVNGGLSPSSPSPL